MDQQERDITAANLEFVEREATGIQQRVKADGALSAEAADVLCAAVLRLRDTVAVLLNEINRLGATHNGSR
jgi:hypothetical protein